MSLRFFVFFSMYFVNNTSFLIKNVSRYFSVICKIYIKTYISFAGRLFTYYINYSVKLWKLSKSISKEWMKYCWLEKSWCLCLLTVCSPLFSQGPHQRGAEGTVRPGPRSLPGHDLLQVQGSQGVAHVLRVWRGQERSLGPHHKGRSSYDAITSKSSLNLILWSFITGNQVCESNSWPNTCF